MAPHGAICTSGAEEIKTATSPANDGGFLPAATPASSGRARTPPLPSVQVGSRNPREAARERAVLVDQAISKLKDVLHSLFSLPTQKAIASAFAIRLRLTFLFRRNQVKGYAR
jgi:hypothetical protein